MTTDPKSALMQKRPKSAVSKERAVSSGSTLLNLACSSDPDYAFIMGGYYFFVGDSASGKTWLTLTCCAEASVNPVFNNYDFIYDNVENGALMDFEFFFGKAAAKRFQSPGRGGENSHTVEDFYGHLSGRNKKGKPFIYVLDSEASLTAGAEIEKFAEQQKALAAGKEVVGAYTDGKAKYHSQHLRQILNGIQELGSILIIITQTRDNVGMSFAPKTRPGGKALTFYSNLELWTRIESAITKRAGGKERQIGNNVEIQVKKNRINGQTGKGWSVIVPIYNAFGIDDTGSCVDFLISEGHWKQVKGTEDYNATDLKLVGTRDGLIAAIEEDGLEKWLKKSVAQVWREIENECIPDRKPRYV